MKRINGLTELIADRDNLRLAFWKAQKSHSAKKEVSKFRKNLEKNLNKLSKEILCGEVNVGKYFYFNIYYPKQRLICAASFKERVLHNALMNICHSCFEKYQIFDSYASRKGKGTMACLKRAEYFQKRYKWYLKLDVRKYFYSISHDILKEKLRRKFKDNKLLSIFDSIIDSYQASFKRGIPIGNLTSQYFANDYLAEVDHYIKETLSIKAYVRYMDDMVLWSNDKNVLINAYKQINSFLEDTLSLELKPLCLNRTIKGLPFLGYILYPYKIKLSRASRKRFYRKFSLYLHLLFSGKINQKTYQQYVLPLLAFAKGKL
jgi:retron-type reverse transcriptase